MFTLGNIIWLIIWAIICVLAGLFIVWWVSDEWYGENHKSKINKAKVIVLICEMVLIVGMFVGCGLYNTYTESGKRSIKTWESETSGGLNRVITVYDMQGNEIARYEGKFDVEENQSNGVVKIKFDIDGKRHIIFAQTGTVIIDEI